MFGVYKMLPRNYLASMYASFLWNILSELVSHLEASRSAEGSLLRLEVVGRERQSLVRSEDTAFILAIFLFTFLS